MSASFPGSGSGHTNLSALQVIGSSVSSLLGPVKGVKCLFDEESNEGVLVTSTNELLQGLDIEHPVGQLAREFCLSQHKRHGSGCTTLVTLAGLWAANVQSLLSQDVPIQDIITAGDEFLQECEDITEQSTISIHTLSKPVSVNAESKEERDGMRLSTTSPLPPLLQSSAGKKPHHHDDIARSEVTAMDRVFVNQNSNNSCALQSQTMFENNSNAVSSGNEHQKGTVSSYLESVTSSLVKKHAHTVLSASCAKLDTSSAILKDDDDDDVSWFFESNSQYSEGAEDIHVHSMAAGKLAAELKDFSLHGQEQNDYSRGGKFFEEIDFEWFFEEDEEIEGMCSVSCNAFHGKCDDHGETIADSTYEEKAEGVNLEVTGLKGTVKHNMEKGRENKSQPLHEQQSVGGGMKREQNQKVAAEGNSVTRTSPLNSSEQFESLLKSAIQQKPSRLLQGSRRILSRHLLAGKQDICQLPVASETPAREIKPKLTSNDLGHRHLTDDKTSVVPILAQRETTSDDVLSLDDAKSVRTHNQNVDVIGILAEDVMRTEEPTMRAEESLMILALGDSLSHGAVAEMKLAIEACQSQLRASQEHHRFRFSPDLVHVQTLTGPPSSSSCCIHGLVLPVHENQLNTLHKMTGKGMAALLLNCDLQESYRHRGFKDSLKLSSTVSGLLKTGTSPACNLVWTERVLSSLKKLNVNLLMVRGYVDSSLVDACCFLNILILEHVPYRLLQLLGTVHKSNLITYIPDALQDDVCENINVSYWSSGYDPHPTVRSRDLKLQHHVRMVCPGDVTSIVLCAPSEPHLAGAEQRLHSCMARLHWALHDGKVLPGGGRIEHSLVEKLLQESGCAIDFQHYHHGLVYKALAQGFRAYIQHIHLNMGQQQPTEDASPDAAGCHCSQSSNVHDCFSAKKGAWQRAWHLVKQVLLCDALIVTGVDEGDECLERVL